MSGRACRACHYGHPNECEAPDRCNKENPVPQFRKKPVVIEARQLTNDNGGEIARWCFGTLRGGPAGGSKGGTVLIDTLEGRMTADPGDWIIEGVRGEFYPCKPEIFAETYDEVTA